MVDCNCQELKFCKSCYSYYYYWLNREDILQTQRKRYKIKKNGTDKNLFKIQHGTFILKF